MEQFAIRVRASFPDVVAWVTEALREQGFGVLTQIDLQETLRTRLGVQMERYLILGACNPVLARRALAVDPSVGVVLPCNVVLREDDESIIVETVAPARLLAATGSPGLEPLAADAARRLSAALDAVASVAGG
jgi:uncharacterized protein (DUF302 family)